MVGLSSILIFAVIPCPCSNTLKNATWKESHILKIQILAYVANNVTNKNSVVLKKFDEECLRLLCYISAQLGTEPSLLICVEPVPDPIVSVSPTYTMAIPVLSFNLWSPASFFLMKSFACVCACVLFLVGFKDLQIRITISRALLVVG